MGLQAEQGIRFSGSLRLRAVLKDVRGQAGRQVSGCGETGGDVNHGWEKLRFGFGFQI